MAYVGPLSHAETAGAEHGDSVLSRLFFSIRCDTEFPKHLPSVTGSCSRCLTVVAQKVMAFLYEGQSAGYLPRSLS